MNPKVIGSYTFNLVLFQAVDMYHDTKHNSISQYPFPICCTIDPCTRLTCTGQGKTCQVNDLGMAVCECNRDCPQVYQPVCGSDGRVYSNRCLMDVKACTKEKTITDGPCPGIIVHHYADDFVIDEKAYPLSPRKRSFELMPLAKSSDYVYYLKTPCPGIIIHHYADNFLFVD